MRAEPSRASPEVEDGRYRRPSSTMSCASDCLLERVLALRPISIAGSADAVVVAERAAIRLLAIASLFELGRVLDLLLGAIDEDLPLVGIDPVGHAGRKHDLLAEDPRAGVDDDVAA